MILVTGATGKVGGELVGLLAGSGRRVRALSRHPSGGTQIDGVEHLAGDLTTPGTLHRAMDGVTDVYLIVPASPTDHQVAMFDRALTAASAAGVGRVVMQSVQFADASAPVEVMRAHAQCEELLRSSRTRWTILRPNSFMHNLLSFAPMIRATAALRIPGEGVRLSLIDVRDVAHIASNVLTTTSTGHDGCLYELTGPQALGFADIAQQIGTATGREVAYVAVDAGDVAEAMSDNGATDFDIRTVLEHLDYWRAGIGAAVTQTTRQLLGTLARTFDAFAKDHAGAFAGTGAGPTS